MSTTSSYAEEIPVAERLTRLPKYYGYKDVLSVVFLNNEDAFYAAWCDESLPLAVRTACEETMAPQTLTNMLLRKVVRGQADLVRVMQALLVAIQQAPEVEHL